MFGGLRISRVIQGAGVLGLMSLPALCSAQVITSAVTNLAGGTFRYNYTIANNTANDLIDVTIHVQASPGSIFNITAPAGFTASPLDSGLGLVDFLENTSFFTAVPLSGFTYDSALAPASSTFDATMFTPAGSLIAVSGPTIAAIRPAAVPEPGSLALIGAFGAVTAAAFLKRRRSRRAQ